MRLPWVSLRTYDALVADYDHLVIEYNDQGNDGRQDYKELLDKYHELAMPKSVAVTSVEMPEREPSIVTLAIREQADGDKGLATYLRAYATKCKREGMSDAQIVDALSKWETTEPDPLSAP